METLISDLKKVMETKISSNEKDRFMRMFINAFLIERDNKAINYTRCCETLPNGKEPISLIIKQIEENANRIIEEVKQVNKFAVNKKTIEEITKLNRLR